MAETPPVPSSQIACSSHRCEAQVTDPKFLACDFFDARDAVQVKYEMVRKVKAGGAPVTEAAPAFGYSRPAYYAAAAALESCGLEELVPARPGPRGRHKLTEEILAWAEERLAADPALRPAQLPDRIADAFGVRVHARSVERGAGPPPGAALQEPLISPPARKEGRSTGPCPCSHHLVTQPAGRFGRCRQGRTSPGRSPPGHAQQHVTWGEWRRDEHPHPARQ